MFGNDVLGLCRSNFFTGDVFGTQVPHTLGAFGQVPFGQVPYGQVPYGFNFGTGITGQQFHPLYGYIANRIPQSFFHQGFVPQTLGNVNTLGAQCLPIFAGQTPFTTPQVLGQSGVGNIGYGFSPYNVANWNWNSPLGFQSQICR